MTAWTPARTKTLILMWSDGAAISQIADALGVTTKAVTSHRRKLGLAPRPRGAPPKAVTPEMEAEIRTLLEQGLTDAAIAKRFDLTHDRIRERRRRLGIAPITRAAAARASRPPSIRRKPAVPADPARALADEFGLSLERAQWLRSVFGAETMGRVET